MTTTAEEQIMEAPIRHPSGTVTWLDLVTTDLTDAAAFYRGLLGWELVTERSRAGLHVVGEVDHHAIAGMLDSVAFEGVEGIARWTVFFRVERLEDSLEVAVSEGGVVRSGPLTMSLGVRIALVEDPAGAVFGLVEQDPDLGVEPSGRSGGFVAAELHTDDLDMADFYAGLFNWTIVRDPDGRSVVFERSGERAAGLVSDSPPMLDAPRWIVYFEVEDLDDAIGRVESLGGAVVALSPEDEIPCAIVSDPEGAVLGLCHH